MQNLIESVAVGSPAHKAGIVAGDRLIAINGMKITDVLDYMYYSGGEKSEFMVEQSDGTVKAFTVVNETGEDDGIVFAEYLMDRTRYCANKCIFCFVDQLPKGMRSSLYFKDDDVRLSFLTGSYITLTNMTEREVQRVIDLKISPINVSVHTTNPELRCVMLGNKNAGRGMEIIKRFAEAGIEMNCQIVCCPGINDGKELKRTMRDLAAMYPCVNSVSVIPVGLTRHREGLFKLEPYTRETARKTVKQVESYARLCRLTRGSSIFFCSDEFYLRAGLPIPKDEYYEEYPQLENGVGLIRLMKTEFCEAVEDAAGETADGASFSLATGVSAAPLMEELIETAKKRWPNINGRVYAIKNDFFGHTVDVAGLVTGGDLIAQLKGKELGERLLIPERMLRQGEGVFLDDVTVEDVERELGVELVPAGQDGASLLNSILGLFESEG